MKHIILFIASAMLITACGTNTSSELTPSTYQSANPASQYCIDNGGQIEIKSDNLGNEYGVCKFDNGSQCDEWAYFRGECSES